MELRHLRVFVTLAEELHFGRAALRLHLTQPSVSGQLRQLETLLGVQLIRRSARRVELTEVGRAFLRDARRIVEQADASAASVARFRDGSPHELRVGYLPDVIPHRLAVALRSISRRFPETRLILRCGEPSHLLADLRGDLLDAVVTSLPAPVKDLRVAVVGFESAVVATTSEGPETTVPIELVAERPVLTLPRRRNPAFHDALVAALTSAGLPVELVETDVASVDLLLMEVACGAGRAFVPASAATRLRVPGVTFRGLAGPVPVGCRLAVVARPMAADVPPLDALIAKLSISPAERALVLA